MSLYVQSVMISSLLLLLDMLRIKEVLMQHPELMDLAMNGDNSQTSIYKLIILALIPVINIIMPIIVLIIFTDEGLTEKFIEYMKNEDDK